MNNQTVYWVWLQNALGYGNKKTIELAGKYSFAEDFYYDLKNGKNTGVQLRQSDLNKLLKSSLEQAVQVQYECIKNDIDIISYADESYPESLRKISNPPALLYIKGNKEVLSNFNSLAVVGPRKPDEYGLRQAYAFSYNLAAAGFTIVSGGALGVDTAAHEGALRADGVSICVLGCGIKYDYLRQNDAMKRKLIDKGALVSEYPPYEPASKYTFPQRNRIVSALSRGVIIVEAAEKSGALITADLAKEQGKDIFAIPGNINSELSAGTNKLIKKGANMATSFRDVLSFYGVTDAKIKSAEVKYELPKKNIIMDDSVKKTSAAAAKKEKTDEKKNNKTIPVLSHEQQEMLSQTAVTILKAFKKPKMHIDELVEVCGLSVAEINAGLGELELFDCVRQESGKEYSVLAAFN